MLLTIIIIINTLLFIFASQTGLTIKSLTAEAILKIDLLQVLSNILKHHPHKDTRNCQAEVKKISHLKPNQLAPSIYIMKELYFFSLDQ